MEKVWQNLRYAIRVLGKNPGFTTVAILSLALGIGANTAIFTLINALVLRDLPVRRPERLVQLSPVRQGNKITFSYPMFREVERRQTVFNEMFAWDVGMMSNVEVDGILSQDYVLAVTGNSYSELGVIPLLGRLLSPDDANPGSGANSQVAVIGYEFWQRRFGGAPDVVGKQIRVEGQPFTIIGVTRKWFTGLTTGAPPEVTIPVTARSLIQNGGGFDIESRSVLWMHPIGRLKDGVSIDQARQQLQSVWPEVLLASASTATPGVRRQTFLSMGLDVSSAANGIGGGLRSQFERPLYVLAGIVGLILLVACVNLANLMLARAAARSHEMSVRMAIGASRSALVIQVLVESLSLSFVGATLGLALAYWGSRFLVLVMTEGNDRLVSLNLNPDWRVLFVTLSVAILTGILFGVAPAWLCSREDPASLLQRDARSLGGRAGQLGKALIVAQIALSLMLLLGAGLFVRSLEELHSVRLGFNKSALLEISLSPKPGGYDNLDMPSYHKQLLERIAAISGVSTVGYADFSIPSTDVWHDIVSEASADPSSGLNLIADGATVSPGFFRMLGIPLLGGRDFSETEDGKHPRVAVVSGGLARRLFPKGDAIGKRIRFGVMPEHQSIEIIGIADDARIFDLREAAAPAVYLSSWQYPGEWGELFVRASGVPKALARIVESEIESLGHEYALRTETIEDVTSQELVEERVTAMLSGFFAALALLLASIGLYGLMSYRVTRRTREIGIRVALGAQRESILWTVLRETLVLVLCGLALGIPCALAASRLIASMLFGLSPSDLPTITGVSLSLLLVALFAGYLPARRASGIDPMVALRHE